jgi:iron complex outermembrane recepter protein
MKLKKITCALFFMFTFPAVAADKGTLTIPTTAVTGNPLGVGSDQMVVPISILNGRELSLKRESTLAETLNSMPGVSNSSFGPSVGRPMIRGMDGDRIKILQNGVNNLDASNLSFDHGVSIDPLIIEQIDVIRGPATLLYGGGAVGGVVNAIDHRIPKEKFEGITGRGEVRYGGANLEQSNAAVVDVGTGNFVMHFDAYNRDSKNLRIPGNAISNRLESTQVWNPEGEEANLDQVHPGEYGTYPTNHGRKKLLNSQSETRGGAVGASMIFDRGYAGLSYAKHQTKYGSVKEPGILLDMDTDRIDFASEIRDLGSFFEKAKFKAAYTDYRHHEMDAVKIHTTFKNKGIDGTFELTHVPLLGLKGVIGTQFDSGKFDVIGDEAFIPNSKTNSQSVYLYEELPLNQHKVTFGLRHGKHNVESKGGGEVEDDGTSHFGEPTKKKFNTNNAAIGGLYKLNEQWSLTGNLSHNERAPSYFELFANGVHTATGVFEQGQSNLKKEKSNGIDGQIRWKSGQDSLTFGAYFNRFSNFNGLLSTNVKEPVEDHHHGEGESHTYYISRFTGIKAEFKGVELEGKTMLTDYLQFNVRGDYVDARNKTSGGYVPRISPLKLGAGLKYEFDRFGARLDVLHAFKQDRVATNYNYEGGKELITDAYTNVSMMATYKLPTQLNLEVFTRANNLLDQEIREHTSFLKDIAPMGGRSIMLGLRGEF